MNQSRFSVRKLILLALLVLVVIGGLLIWNASRFRVTSIVPNTSRKVATATSVIKITFSKPLSSDAKYDRDLVDDPLSIVRDITREDKALLIHLNHLEKDQTYFIGVKQLTAQSGAVIKKINLRFTAVYMDYEELSKEQQAQELDKTDKGPPADPLAPYLPHSTLKYSLHGSNEADEEGNYIFVINAKILLSAADVRIDREGAIAKTKQEIEAFIKSYGYDPANYLIRYTVSESY